MDYKHTATHTTSSRIGALRASQRLLQLRWPLAAWTISDVGDKFHQDQFIKHHTQFSTIHVLPLFANKYSGDAVHSDINTDKKQHRLLIESMHLVEAWNQWLHVQSYMLHVQFLHAPSREWYMSDMSSRSGHNCATFAITPIFVSNRFLSILRCESQSYKIFSCDLLILGSYATKPQAMQCAWSNTTK